MPAVPQSAGGGLVDAAILLGIVLTGLCSMAVGYMWGFEDGWERGQARLKAAMGEQEENE